MTTVGICGFGRCGSTMVMEMLSVGGIPTADGADPHSHEHTADLSLTSLPLARLDGRAVKLLDGALHFALPDVAWKFVWLDRDVRQQAKSAVKLLRGVGVPVPARAALEFEASFLRDRPRILALLQRSGPVHMDSYERAVREPSAFAADLAAFLAPDLRLDVAAAAGAVHQRSARCAPGLLFETGATA